MGQGLAYHQGSEACGGFLVGKFGLDVFVIGGDKIAQRNFKFLFFLHRGLPSL